MTDFPDFSSMTEDEITAYYKQRYDEAVKVVEGERKRRAQRRRAARWNAFWNWIRGAER